MIDILPMLAPGGEESLPDRKTMQTWMLVLQSQGILCRTEAGPRLLVSPAMAQAACAEIMAYERENRTLPRPEPLPDNSWISLPHGRRGPGRVLRRQIGRAHV